MQPGEPTPDEPALVARDTLYYDGACPLCSAEVARLERLAGGQLALKDIHRLDAGEVAIDRETLLGRLHLETADGRWLTGMDANIRAWQHTPWRGLWRMLDWPVLNRVSRWGYEAWLRWRQK